MPISKYKKAKIDRLQMEAFELYKQGYSVREIGRLKGFSHTYIWLLIRAVDKSLA